MKKKVSALEAHLGYWLRMVSNRVSHEFKRKVEETGVTVAEWVVLRKLLETEPAFPAQIADALGMTRGAISKLHERLLAKELIAISPSLTDRRAQIVELTHRGRVLVPKLAALADENDAAFFGVLDDAEQKKLRTLLEKLMHVHGIATPPVD